MTDTKWIPLESNPTVWNEYAMQLGMTNDYEFVDVWSLDSACIDFLNNPVCFILLFPSKPKIEDRTEPFTGYFIKQTVDNACGTIALVHSLSELPLSVNSPLSNYISRTSNMTPKERASELEAWKFLHEQHKANALSGQTDAVTADLDTNLHFVCIKKVGQNVFEFDGRFSNPLKLGSDLVQSTRNRFETLMNDCPGDEFSILALVSK